MTDIEIMDEILGVAQLNVRAGGRPFAAAVVRDGSIIAEAANMLHVTHDPSSHAEIEAIRGATRLLSSPDLSQCRIFTIGLPCLMCTACIVLSGMRDVIYAIGGDEKAKALMRPNPSQGLYDTLVRQLAKPAIRYHQIPGRAEQAGQLFSAWAGAQEYPDHTCPG